MDNAAFVVAAYTVTAVFVVVYTWRLWRRLGAARRVVTGTREDA